MLALTDPPYTGLRQTHCRLLSHREPGEKLGIVVSLREGAIRVAPHFYNTHEEIERLLAALPSR